MSTVTISRTATRIDELLQAGRPALVGYLPVGFPDVARSVEAVTTMVDAGVDVVEIGVPYTDPVMDGPVIQRAAEAALAGGARVRDVLTIVEAVGGRVPTLVMSYYNPILRYGVGAFARDLAAAGGAGAITPDLIPDEAGEWVAAADEHDLDKVFLVAPSSTPERLQLTARAARGFVYASSTMGVTGAREAVGRRAEQLVADTRAAGAERVCVGIGVSTGDHAAEVGRYADGVIVGSALVRTLLSDDPWSARLDHLGKVTGELAAGVARARTLPGGTS